MIRSRLFAVAVCIALAACQPAEQPQADAAAGASMPATTAEVETATPTPMVDDTAASPADTAAIAGNAHVDQTIDELLGDHAPYRAAIDALQSAVAKSDAAAVARLVHYPIDVTIDGSRTRIEDEQTFVAQYRRFMTPAIARAIVDTRYADVLVNYRGVMLGSGEAWINGICSSDSAGCERFEVKVVALQPTLH